MSCEPNRQRFLLHACGGDSALAATLERVYQRERGPADPAEAIANQAKTRLLFAQIGQQGMQPPTHSPSGLPRVESQRGYAALWDELQRRANAGEIARCSGCGQFTGVAVHMCPRGVAATVAANADGYGRVRELAGQTTTLLVGTAAPAITAGTRALSGVDARVTAGTPTPSGTIAGAAVAPANMRRHGYDADGYDRHGYDREGFNRQNFDREGYDKQGFNAAGFNRQGFDRTDYDAAGLDWLGFDRNGFNANGVDRYGYDRNGVDEQGFNRSGYDRTGFNRRGYNQAGFDQSGRDYYGYNKSGFAAAGYSLAGYDARGFDTDGFDRQGYGADGYDRQGYDARGRDRQGKPHSWLAPDSDGCYGDGFDEYGYDRAGYNAGGFDRWGFSRDGYSLFYNRDRDGYDRNGFNRNGRDRAGYDWNGYDSSGYDRRGYDKNGLDRAGYTVAGYDKDGYDRNSADRWGRDRSGKDLQTGKVYKTSPYNKSGWDKDGYDRWGFNRATGLTQDGRNYAGWIHDPAVNECYDPADPTRRMPHNWGWDRRSGRVTWARPKGVVVKPPIDPRTPPTRQEYAAANGAVVGYDNLVRTPPSTVQQRWESTRHTRDPQATKDGIYLRCPHCGQFTGGTAHRCPGFNGNVVSVYRSGLAYRNPDYFRAGEQWSNLGRTLDNRNIDGVPVPLPNGYGGPYPNGRSAANPYPGTSGRDPDYRWGGFNSPAYRSGTDAAGYDRQGYNARGYNRAGFDRQGYNIFGFDKDGFDKEGYDKNGLDPAGQPRKASLDDLLERYTGAEIEGDLLANPGMARLYGQLAGALSGKERRVVFTDEGLGSTDMKSTIYLNPYPLGKSAPPTHNHAVARSVLYHEIGHEMITPPETWARVLDIAQSEEPVEGLDAGRSILPHVYNIVEDGRMERRLAAGWAGCAEALAVGCRLFPRWHEQVGPGVSLGDQVQWALLYEGLPYFQLREEVRRRMTSDARKLFDELRPVVRQGVFGTADDAFQASLTITRRFEQEGIFQPPPNFGASAPFGGQDTGAGEQAEGQSGASGGQNSQQGARQSGGAGAGGQPGGAGGQPGQAGRQGGGGQPGQQQQSGQPGGNGSGQQRQDQPGNAGTQRADGGPQAGAVAGDQPAPDAGSEQPGPDGQNASGQQSAANSGAGDQQVGAGSGDPAALRDVDAPFSNSDVAAALEQMEREAVTAIQSDLRRQGKVEHLGRRLHQPLANRTEAGQVFRTPQGEAASAQVGFPRAGRNTAWVRGLQERQARHEQIARAMARRLALVRDQVEQRLNMQETGSLDRAGFVPGMKGARDIYQRDLELPKTSFTASVAVDLSGSMDSEMRSGALYDAVGVLAATFEDQRLSVPYEVRGFSNGSFQYKAMEDQTFEPERAAMLLRGEGGGTSMYETAGLATTSLRARPEKNKLLVALTDGALGDHAKTAATLADARRNGVLTFGVFFARGTGSASALPGDLAATFDDLYGGRANWTVINSLDQMPEVVGQRIATQMQRIR